jgi:hypothetical protein
MKRDPAFDMMLALPLPYMNGRTTKVGHVDHVDSFHGNLPASAWFFVAAAAFNAAASLNGSPCLV